MDNMILREEMIMYNRVNSLPYPEIQKYTICWYWNTYWGSFVKALAEALDRADIHNERKIRENWNTEIEENLQILIDYENTLWD